MTRVVAYITGGLVVTAYLLALQISGRWDLLWVGFIIGSVLTGAVYGLIVAWPVRKAAKRRHSSRDRG